MNSIFSETGRKRKGGASDEDSSDEKDGKRARLEVLNDTDNSKEQETTKISNGQNENEESPNESVENAVEYNIDDNTKLQSVPKIKKNENDQDGSEKKDNESKHAVTKESLEGEGTTSKIYSRSDSSDSSVNETLVTESVVVYKRENEADENRCNTEREQETQEEENEYVYRILRFNESPWQDLRPKNINSRVSLEKHVGEGSKGVESRYISCCKTMYALRRLGGITNESSRVRKVVRINISKLDRDNVQVIDLTDEDIRKQHISSSSPAWEYAEKFDEVILAPTSHVPKEFVEKIGKIHRRLFVKDEHIELD